MKKNTRLDLLSIIAFLMITLPVHALPDNGTRVGVNQKRVPSGDGRGGNLFTCNANAHLAISKPGELLASYRVNSLKCFDDSEVDPDLNRPRFVRIIVDKE